MNAQQIDEPHWETPMIRPVTLTALFLFFFAAQSCTKNIAVADSRSIDGIVLTSTIDPALTFRPSKEFQFVGDFTMTLKDTALAERHHWVATNDNNQIQKLLIVQFERFLDDVEGEYSFSVPSSEISGSNYKFSPTPVSLGGIGFIHNTWALDHAANASERPAMEAAATLALLKEKGYLIDDELIMSRFVQSFGENNRHELIIFYFEPLSSGGKFLKEFPDGGPPSAAYDTYSDAVTTRSLDAFEIVFTAK